MNTNNRIFKFKDLNPINRGSIDSINRIGEIVAKDLHNLTKDILDPDDDSEDIDLVWDADIDIDLEPYNSYPYGFVGAPMAIGDSMSESLGVPDEIDPWLDLLYSFIRSQIYIFVDTVKSTDEYDTNAEIGGVKFVSKSLVFNVIDNEFDSYIDEYIPKDNGIKVENMKIDLGISTIPDDIFTFDSWHASFSDSDSFIKNGVYTDIKFMFEFLLPESILKLSNPDDIDDFLYENGSYKKMVEFLSHELTHLYEYYNRKLNNIEVWSDRLLNTNKFVVEKELLSNVSDDWIDFLNLIYLSLDFEINARVSQLYYSLNEDPPKSKYDFIKKVKNNSVWEEMNLLKNFNSEKFYSDFKYKSSDKDLKSVFIKLNIYTEDELSGDIKPLLIKELIKLWDRNIDNTNNLYESGEMVRLSPYYINNPLSFFKKFEQRFKNKSEIWERKIYRLAARFDF